MEAELEEMFMIPLPRLVRFPTLVELLIRMEMQLAQQGAEKL